VLADAAGITANAAMRAISLIEAGMVAIHSSISCNASSTKLNPDRWPDIRRAERTFSPKENPGTLDVRFTPIADKGGCSRVVRFVANRCRTILRSFYSLRDYVQPF
jgi:hypothetical protein